MYAELESTGFMGLYSRLHEEVGYLNFLALYRVANSKQAWISSGSKLGKSAKI